MNLGIVGPEGNRFGVETTRLAVQAIHDLIVKHRATCIVSGHCPKGGVDLFAEEVAEELKMERLIYAAAVDSWDAPGGYRARNLKIARNSDLVAVVTLREAPPWLRGEGVRLEECYHCGIERPRHVRSGGCWTAKRAKRAEWVIL